MELDIKSVFYRFYLSTYLICNMKEREREREGKKVNNNKNKLQLYSEHIDNKGHQFGPISSEVKQAVKEMDYHLDRFLTMLEQHKLNETVISTKKINKKSR